MFTGRGRVQRVFVAVTIASVLILAGVQVTNTVGVRDELLEGCAGILGEGEGVCESRTRLSSVQLSIDAGARGRELKIERSQLDANTWLVRRNCEGEWSIGFGARGEIQELEVANQTAALAVGRGCIDMRRAGLHGTLTNARLSTQECVIHLAPFQFDADGPLQVKLGATFDAATMDACQQLVPPSLAASAASLASARLDLEASYAIASSAAPVSQSREATTQRKDGVGIVRRIISSGPTSHTLTATLDGRNATVRLETEPAADAIIMTLSMQADEALANQLPADIRPQASGPLTLDVRWPLDHGTGTVHMNGAEIRRHPLRATRPAGRVALPRSECAGAGTTRSLFFVEADDAGEALDSSQLDAIFTAVCTAVDRTGALVAVFVHGWHHSASPGDTYVCRFSDVLASVEEMERRAARLAGRPAREIVGVYVGWQGSLYPNDLANSVTTFWNRLDAADRMGRPDALLHRLLSGLSQRLADRNAVREADRRSSFVVVGHSLGARAAFSALRGDLLRDAAARDKQPGPDLVLLVNPAFSASLYRSVHERTRECRPETAPLLLFSSETDGVTRQVYPAGQTLTYSDGGAEPAPFFEHIYTAANFGDFVTHRLTLEVVSGEPPDPDGAQTILRGFERTPAGSVELYSDNPVLVYRQPAIGRPTPRDVWYRMRLVEVAARPAPCDITVGGASVVAVDQRVLPDHGRIFTPPFVEYIVRMLNRRAMVSSGSP